jgi:DNA repair protein RadC
MKLIDKRGVQILKLTAKKAEIEGVKINSSKQIWEFCLNIFDFETLHLDEDFYVIMLSRNLHTKGVFHVSKGGMYGTVVCLHKMFAAILQYGCSCIALAHNHPTGTMVASEADKDITRKIKEACRILEIKLVDHVIISDNSYLSFADEGIL